MSTFSNLTFRVRPSGERGHSDIGWLNSHHTFAVAHYHAPDFENFGALRVMNEDRVAGGKGFGRHPHRDFEIFSYVVRGALKHDDSMGNVEVVRRGDVQFTSAGSGVQHAEFNNDASEYVHFLQMWVTPHTRGLTPAYQTRHWSDEQKLNQLRLLISPDGQDDTIRVAADCKVYATLLDAGASVKMEVAAGRRAYVMVVSDVTGMTSEKRESSVLVSGGGAGSEGGVTLQDGDGCFVELRDGAEGGVLQLTGSSAGSKRAEVIVFDLA